MSDRDPTVEALRDFRVLVGLLRDDFDQILRAKSLTEAQGIARTALLRRLENSSRRRST